MVWPSWKTVVRRTSPRARGGPRDAWRRRRIQFLPHQEPRSARRRRCRGHQRLGAGRRESVGCRNGGQVDRYHHVEAGVNSRLDELQAAVLRARLPFLRAWTDERRRLAAVYRASLARAPVTLPVELDSGHVYHLFVVRVGRGGPNDCRRAELQNWLRTEGIETFVHYPVPIPQQAAFAAAGPADCPQAAAACQELLSLPLYPGLNDSDVAVVAAALARFHGWTIHQWRERTNPECER